MKPEVIPFRRAPRLCSQIAALGIFQEVGTKNDELARFVYDPVTDAPVPIERLRAQLIEGAGVRVWAEGHDRIELRFPGIRALLHPRSFHDDGTISQLLIYPEVIAKFLAAHRVEAVIVVPWAKNTIFGGFHPSQGYYQTNMWELTNIDVIRYARLVENRQVPFLGTHDLVAHIAGTRGEAWDDLVPLGRRVREHIENYFSGVSLPCFGSTILPYIVGILLDDLAQPPCYGTESRRFVIEKLLAVIDRERLSPTEPLVQLKFPTRYEKLVELARWGAVEAIQAEAPRLVEDLVREIRTTAALLPAA